MPTCAAWILLASTAISTGRALQVIPFPSQLQFGAPPSEIITLSFKVSKGDIVTWKFSDADKAQNHSVIQVSYDNPCTPLPNGFASPIGALNTNGEFSITIEDDSAPIYWSCASTGPDSAHDHCQEGEVGVLSRLDISQADHDQIHKNAREAAHTGALGRVAATVLGSGAGGARVSNTSAVGSPNGSSSTNPAGSATPSGSGSSELPAASSASAGAPLSTDHPQPNDGGSSSTETSAPHHSTSLAIIIVPALLGAAVLGGLVYLIFFIRRRRRAAREAPVTPLVANTAQTYDIVSQPDSLGWGGTGSQRGTSSDATGQPSQLAAKAKALGMMPASGTSGWTEGSTTSRGLASSVDAMSDRLVSDVDGSQWQAVQQAARGAGFTPQALIASLTRVQNPERAHEGSELGGETLPPRYDG